jgi:hypothetical protein
MPDDFLQFSAAFRRDFSELRSAVERIAARAHPDDPESVDRAVLEAVKFIEDRCAGGGATMLFQQSSPPVNRERLTDALTQLILRKIAAKQIDGDSGAAK